MHGNSKKINIKSMAKITKQVVINLKEVLF